MLRRRIGSVIDLEDKGLGSAKVLLVLTASSAWQVHCRQSREAVPATRGSCMSAITGSINYLSLPHSRHSSAERMK